VSLAVSKAGKLGLRWWASWATRGDSHRLRDARRSAREEGTQVYLLILSLLLTVIEFIRARQRGEYFSIEVLDMAYVQSLEGSAAPTSGQRGRHERQLVARNRVTSSGLAPFGVVWLYF
jgi:hypothetical protein